ncbi:decarboxylating 6-phosphogluconate dehydrogenase [Hamiltosporidium magnivora]|uniref:6-phosphogluconate dehydrogenase, decarboxylating n=2 Tax=Hamiltosporidium TaxID=1176354 RepID=A0A4Q9LHR3_9MICR|nr:decarboxylating 6-phosphogluconate dehydrogenase [Hamiltosporidium magnivora]
MDVGLIGLGVMGKNLVLNIADHGYSVAVYNRTYNKTIEFITETNKNTIKGYEKLEDFIFSLKEPKIIFIMVMAGTAIDKILEEISGFLGINAVVIDGGNSHYLDTERRCYKYFGRFNYIGCGISGGEEGARYGPSLMPGGNKEGWVLIKELLCVISAKFKIGENEFPCCEWMGEGGSGHFVKMVHNGIEYGDMAILSELYLIMKYLGMENEKMADTFKSWNDEHQFSGYLLNVMELVLKKKEKQEYIINSIEDKSEQKGTGRWCVVASIENTTPSTLMAESVYSRFLSNQKDLRIDFSKKIDDCLEITNDINLNEDDLKRTFFMAKAVSYVQGFNLLRNGSKNNNWDLNLPSITRIWRNGCIIRSNFLEVIENIVQEVDENFELSDIFINICKQNIQNLRKVVGFSICKGIPVPVLSACLEFFDILNTKRGGGNIIQALRDYFGSHMVRFLGKDEDEHVEW